MQAVRYRPATVMSRLARRLRAARRTATRRGIQAEKTTAQDCITTAIGITRHRCSGSSPRIRSELRGVLIFTLTCTTVHLVLQILRDVSLKEMGSQGGSIPATGTHRMTSTELQWLPAITIFKPTV